jgi:hypothetical protein
MPVQGKMANADKLSRWYTMQSNGNTHSQRKLPHQRILSCKSLQVSASRRSPNSSRRPARKSLTMPAPSTVAAPRSAQAHKLASAQRITT